ncbi:MAG: hypothetical protein QF473_06145 [Planctomycetota bacterium]|nr:hypothetical protein [Planctomycetota bacterium]
MAGDGSQGIVDFVRHAGCHAANSGKAFGVGETALGTSQQFLGLGEALRTAFTFLLKLFHPSLAHPVENTYDTSAYQHQQADHEVTTLQHVPAEICEVRGGDEEKINFSRRLWRRIPEPDGDGLDKIFQIFSGEKIDIAQKANGQPLQSIAND